MKKKLAAIMLAAAMVFGAVPSVGTVQAATVQTEKAPLPVIENASELSSIGAFYTKNVYVDKKEGTKLDQAYIEFTVSEPSWVYLWNVSSMVTSESDCHSTHVDIYSDAGFTNKIGECGSGFWEYTESFSGFLPKGTYYIHMKTTQENIGAFEGNINMCGGAIPVSKIFDAKVSVSKDQKSATVSMPNVLGEYVSYVEYQPGNISLNNVNDNKYWQWAGGGVFIGGSDAVQVLTEKDGAYTFTAKNNGAYTIMMQEQNGDRYSVVVKVSGIDKTKPAVSGVKNGKTYKKAVTIKFSDKGSGIKSAKLNGKSMKSGAKVSKKGTYTLVVTDKAGNKNTVKFKIK